jgi:hypothetical protein
MLIYFKRQMKVTDITENGIKFTDGSMMKDVHFQDCCEAVYAAWKALLGTGIQNEAFSALAVESVKDSGFNILISADWYAPTIRYFVPCYNIQNGYYGSDLSIQFETPDGISFVKDVSDCTREDYDA